MTNKRPLSPLALLLYPLLVLGKTGSALESLNQRRDLTIRNLRNKRYKAALRKKLKAEAQITAKILVARLVGLGGYYAFRWKYDESGGGGRKTKRRRVQKVRFRRIVTTPELLAFEILTGTMRLFRYVSAIPHKVLLKDLISPETLTELSYAVRRPVSIRQDPEHGVWYVVHRNQSASNIPDHVTYADMLPHYPEDAIRRGTLIIGVGMYRTVHSFDLDSYPHILIAGASGGGKSNMLNNLLCALIRFHTVEALQLVLIDPKRLELGRYRQTPHLRGDVVFDIDQAIDILEEMLNEVIHRTELMLPLYATKLSEYNARVPAEHRLPRIVIVVDELAALMRGKREWEQVKHKLTQIANLGRAVGIHLILCTQLPIVEVIPSKIKVSMWVRMAFRVQNSTESVTILGTGDAAKLPAIAGRVLYGKDSFRHEVQTPLCTLDDVLLSVKIAKGRQLGWVKLDGHTPIIDADNLLWAIAHNPMFRRQLSVGSIASIMRDYGISRAQVKTFVEDVINANTIILGNEEWRVTCLGNTATLEPVNDEAAASAQEAEAAHLQAMAEERERFFALLNPPLMLPAPKPPETLTEPRIPDEDAIFQQFLDDCCDIDWKVETSARHLYAGYKRWCNARDMRPASQIALGKWLSAQGFRMRHRSDGNWWRGVHLIDDQAPDGTSEPDERNERNDSTQEDTA